MSARGAIGGVARPLSSVTDRDRGRRPMLVWAVALCGIALLCTLETADAVGGLRSHFRRQAGTSKAVQLLTSTIPSTYPSAATTPSKPEPKRVKCYYFDRRPARTYCHILGLTGPIDAQQAEGECRAISMDMLSMNTTTDDRLCVLMNLFGLEEHKLWLADVFDQLQPQPHSWEKCKVEVLNASSTKAPSNPSNCTICNIAVVCDAGFYHSNGPNCVTVEEGSSQVEYCYHNDRIRAAESTSRCLEHAARPLDVWELNGTLLEYVKPLVRTDLEFWVDLREEDVRNLSGVIAFDTRNIDWNTSCVTVWFGRDVPWFFKRNCSDFFPIVCEDTVKKQLTSIKNYGFPDCLYHRSHSWMFDYCIPEGHTYDKGTGSEFCNNHSMSLLRGSTLDELFYVYTHVHGRPRQSYDRFLIWDARYSGAWSQASNTCLATLLVETPPGKHPRSCSQKLGYICKQIKKSPQDPYCENINRSSVDRPDTCLSQSYWTYEDSIQFCAGLGMRLLPDGKDVWEYEAYLERYEDMTQGGLYWLGPELGERCVATQNPSPVRMTGKDCSELLRVVCLSSNGSTFPTSGPGTKSSLLMSTNTMAPPYNTIFTSATPMLEDTDLETRETPSKLPGPLTFPTAAGPSGGDASLPSALPETRTILFTPLTDTDHSQHDEVDPQKTSTTPDSSSTGRSTSVPELACAPIGEWHRTAAGSVASIPCLGSNRKVMTRKCSKEGQWSQTVNDSLCFSEGYPESVEKTKSMNVSKVIEGFEELKKRVEQPADVKGLPYALQYALDNFDMVAMNTSEDERAAVTLHLTTTIVDLASVAMDNPRVWRAIPQDDKLRTAANLATKVESFVIKMIQYQPSKPDGLTVGSGKLIMTVKPVTEKSLNTGATFGNASATGAKFPPNFLPKGTKNATVIFSENSLVKDIFSCSAGSSRQASANSRIPATSFLTASAVVNGQRTANIEGDVTLSFDYECIGGIVEPSCSFIADSGDNWSGKGCELVEVTENKIVCSCNHLTVFAVLMSPRSISDAHIAPLEWITKIGCGISIVCLIACIIIFSVYRQLRGIRNTIHRNLCLSLLIAEILLLAGMERKSQNRASCMAVAFLLHFFFLAAFGWMALEGCHIIVLLWKVFNQKRTYYERYYFAGYGIPLIIAGITMACRHQYYAPGKNATNTTPTMMPEDNTDRIEFCWLPAEKGVRYSFIGPVAAVIVLNVGALCLVLWKMSHVRLVVEKSTAEKVQNWVRGTFILLPILGVTWLFGFLMLGNENLHTVGAYLFTIFNSLQGLGIFICHVFMSKKTREAIFRSVVSTGSFVKGSMSSRPSGSGSSSTKTTCRSTLKARRARASTGGPEPASGTTCG
ncbi:uncharacterized protein LOC144125507 isoform X2 [Amblyomma americanum]